MATTSGRNLATQIEAELICVVCQERFTSPRVLPCQHSFCESCLSMAHLAREHRGRLLPCPTCRAVAVIPDNGVQGFPINFALNNLVQILTTTENEVRRTPQEHCSLHENRKITMYCCDCHVTTCSTCAATSHAKHHTEIILDVVDSEREALREVLSEMGSAIEKSDAELNTVNEMLEKITKQTEAAIIKINKEAEKVIDEVNKKKVGLVGQVNALKIGQTEKIASFKEDLKSWSKKRKEVKQALENILNTQDDVAFLQGASELRGDLKPRENSSNLSELNSASVEKWIDFHPASNLATQIECLDMGEVKLTKDEPVGTNAVLNSNSRVNTARRHRRRNTAGNSREGEQDTPLQINLERFTEENALIIRYTDQRRGNGRTQSSANAPRIRAIHQIGSCGTNLGDFFHPCGMSQLSNGHLVVADQRNNRVQILEENGSFVQMFGNEGTGIREFKSPGDIAVDSEDNIYVLDTRNDRIQVFTADGRYKKIIGGIGTGPGKFCKPQAITIATTGEILVADSGNNRIQVLLPDGRFSHSFGREGSGEGEFMEPCGVATSGNDVYVCDHHSHRIQVFRLTGEFRSTFGSFGSEHGQLSYPSSVAVDSSGSVIVSEYGNDRLSVFDGVGRFKMCFGDEGNDLGQFLSPNGVSICVPDANQRSRNVKFYACDAWNHRLQMLEMIC